MPTDPYAGLGTPVESADPYAGLGTPTPTRTLPRPATTTGGKILRSYGATHRQAIVNGIFMQPTRMVMEGLGYGMKELKAAVPGQTEEWYKKRLHDEYNKSIRRIRQKTTDIADANKIDTSGNPSLGTRAARVAQQTANVGANVIANPHYFLIPGLGLGGGTAAKITSSAAGQAGIKIGSTAAAEAALGGATDAAAQGLDILTGTKDKFDIEQNLNNTLLSGAFGGAVRGGIEVAPFVKNLFNGRGEDTTPNADPRTPITPRPEPVEQNPAATYQQSFDEPDVEINKWAEQNNTAVKEHIGAQTATWKNAPEYEIVNRPEQIEDATIRDQVLAEDPDGNSLGFLGTDGKVRIFSDRIPDQETANAVLFHESLGHFGLAQKFGDRLDQTIESLYARNVSQFAKHVDEWMKKNPGAYGGNKIRAAEEVLAEYSQNGRIPASWQNALSAAVRQFGRRLGHKIAYSDAEIRHILAMAHDAVINGKPGAAANGFRGSIANPDSTNRFMSPTPGAQYEIIDRQTGKVVAYAKTKEGARRAVDNRDNAYGAYRYQSRPISETGNRFMFTGPSSAGFDPESPSAYTAKDGVTRNEISDQTARVKVFLHEGDRYPLSDVLHHPELFEKYPQLRDIEVRGVYSNGKFEGGYNHLTKTIFVDTVASKDNRQTILHEVQHAIQDIEQYPSFVKTMEDGGVAAKDFKEYKNHPVEAEAFATEERSSMTTGLREIVPPKFMRADQFAKLPTEEQLRWKDVGLRDMRSAIRVREEDVMKTEDFVDAHPELKGASRSTIRDALGDEVNLYRTKIVRALNEGTDKAITDMFNYINQDIRTNRKMYEALDNAKTATGIHENLPDWVHPYMDKMLSPAEDIDTTPPLPLTDKDVKDYKQWQYMARTSADPHQKAAFQEGLDTTFGDIPPEVMEDIVRASSTPKAKGPQTAKQVIVYDTRTNEIAREFPTRHAALTWIREQPHNSQYYGIDRMGTDQKYITRNQLASSPDYEARDLEGIYKALDEGFTPVKRSFAQEQQEALAAGFTPKQIKAMAETGQGELSNRLWRLQAAANLADIQIQKLNKKLGTPEWSAKDQAAYLSVLADRNYYVTRVRGERAELGRALNVAKAARSYGSKAMEEIQALMEMNESGLANLATDPTSFNKFAMQIKQLMEEGNTKGAHTIIDGLNKPYWEQYLNTFHMNAMLSAGSTQAKAAVDTATGIARDVIERALAIPVGKLRQVVETMTGRKVQPGVSVEELVANVTGLVKAVTNAEVYRRALETARTGGGGYVSPSGEFVPVNFINQYGSTSNPRIPGISIPADLLAAQDVFWRSFTMSQNLHSLAVREAWAQLGPKASRADVLTLADTLARAPTKAMLDEATDLSLRTMLMNNNPINDLVAKGKTYRPGMKPWQRVGAFIINNLAPFIRVESNSLFNRFIQRSPLGFLDGYTRAQLKAGGAQADIALTKILYGTTLMGMYWVGADAAKDYLKGDGSRNPNKRKELAAAGEIPRSVHEDGKYKDARAISMSINPFDMKNSTAATVASLREAWDVGANKGQIGTAFYMTLGGLMHNLAEMSWVNEFSPWAEALTASGDQAENKAEAAIAGHARSWSPNLMSQVARLTDNVKRDTSVNTDSGPGNMAQRVGNELASTVPGLRQKLPIKYSVYGTPLQQGTSITGIHNGTTETTNPAEIELNRLAKDVESAIITAVQKTVKVDGEERKLTPHEFQEYQRLAGQNIVLRVEEEMSNPEWQIMSDTDKIKKIRKIQTTVKKLAREELFGNDGEDEPESIELDDEE
jgi:hypothetical protein